MKQESQIKEVLTRGVENIYPNPQALEKKLKYRECAHPEVTQLEPFGLEHFSPGLTPGRSQCRAAEISHLG